MPFIKLLPAVLLFAGALAAPAVEKIINEGEKATPSSCLINGQDFSSIARELDGDLLQLLTHCPLSMDLDKFTKLIGTCCKDMDEQPVCQSTQCPTTSTDPVSLDAARWIWTAEARSGTIVDVPVGHRPFRRSIPIPSGNTVKSVEVLAAGDDAYTVYVNGDMLGSGTGWQSAVRFTTNHVANINDTVVVAVDAYNAGGPAGYTGCVQITSVNDCGCPTVTVIYADSQWLYDPNCDVPDYQIPEDFMKPGYSAASTWKPVTEEGPSTFHWGMPGIPVLPAVSASS